MFIVTDLVSLNAHNPGALFMGHRPNTVNILRENLSSLFVNNKGENQPTHPHTLISAFVIRVYESNMSKRVTSKFPIF